MTRQYVTRWFPRMFCGVALGFVAVSFAHPAAADDPAAPAVAITNFAFDAQTITISVGATLTWTNNDRTEHSATSNDGVWDSGKIVPGASYSYTFTTPGTYDYYCKYHTFMKGTVLVIDNATPIVATPDSGAPAATVVISPDSGAPAATPVP